MRFNFFYAGLLVWAGCTTQTQTPQSIHQVQDKYQKDKPKVNLSTVRLGLDVLIDDKLELIRNKSIGLVTNNSGIDNKGVSNYERLMEIKDISINVIFSPEHGLFGEAAAGEKVDYNGQIKTLPKIVSLYGDNRKPTQTQMEDIDIIIYDIQDIGARFYTYISTLGMVMESASKYGVKVLVLDRPNPIGGNIVEGPILDLKFPELFYYLLQPIEVFLLFVY